MSKSKVTKKLEEKLYNLTDKIGTFGCFEVTFDNERVDFLTYDSKSMWKCYEIKSSKSDFYSGSAWTFIGHYNYFIMEKSLYEVVKRDVPYFVGVHDGINSIKRAKKMTLGADEQLLKDSMIRSLSREQRKSYEGNTAEKVNELKKEVNRHMKEKKKMNMEVIAFNQLVTSIRRADNLQEIKDKYKSLFEE